MSRLCKLLVLLADTLLFSLVAVMGRASLFLSPASERRFLAHAARWWSKSMVMILGLQVLHNIKPRDRTAENFLIVANHQSYLDVVVIGSLFPTLLVAKSEVRKWPIIGWFATLGGTVYVDRKAFRGAINAAKQIAQALSQGISVQIFPEGTSTNGDHVLPFKPSLFGAAVASHVKILPITIRYVAINDVPFEPRTRDYVCWYGDMSFAGHFWNMLGQKSITVSVAANPVIPPEHYPDSKQIAELAHYYVSKKKTEGVNSSEPP